MGWSGKQGCKLFSSFLTLTTMLRTIVCVSSLTSERLNGRQQNFLLSAYKPVWVCVCAVLKKAKAGLKLMWSFDEAYHIEFISN